MWVADYFDGDNDPSAKVSWIQHDAYREALRLIACACVEHMKSAFMLAFEDYPKKWDRSFKYDHRTLQLAHDVIAAAWRFECIKTELPLFFQTDHEDVIFRKWFAWLRSEVDLWSNQSAIVRNVIIILGDQNVENGYRAEDLLIQALVRRYLNVPWHDRFLALAYKEVLPLASLELGTFKD